MSRSRIQKLDSIIEYLYEVLPSRTREEHESRAITLRLVGQARYQNPSLDAAAIMAVGLPYEAWRTATRVRLEEMQRQLDRCIPDYDPTDFPSNKSARLIQD